MLQFASRIPPGRASVYRHRRVFRLVIAGLFSLVLTGHARGHTINPAVATVTFGAGSEIRLDIRTNVEALLARIGPEHADTRDSPNAGRYDRYRAMPPVSLAREFDAFLPEFIGRLDVRIDGQRLRLEFSGIEIPEVGDVELARNSVIRLKGRLPGDAAEFSWNYPEDYGSSVLRIQREGRDDMQAVWLQPGEASEPYVLSGPVPVRTRADVIRDYTILGFTHIVPKGLDHILFVLGIFLLSLRLRPILWQVTAFTVAHTITLGMSIYGLVSLPASLVEPLIAASIVYVGVENILLARLKPWRVVIVFGFGLLHGLGFAGVLTEIGLPRSEFLTALLSFNAGVEGGQLAVIGIGFAAVGWFRHRPWYRTGIVIPVSALISLVGAYWTVERLL